MRDRSFENTYRITTLDGVEHVVSGWLLTLDDLVEVRSEDKKVNFWARADTVISVVRSVDTASEGDVNTHDLARAVSTELTREDSSESKSGCPCTHG